MRTYLIRKEWRFFLHLSIPKRVVFLGFRAPVCPGRVLGARRAASLTSACISCPVRSRVPATYQENEELTGVDWRVNVFPRCFLKAPSVVHPFASWSREAPEPLAGGSRPAAVP